MGTSQIEEEEFSNQNNLRKVFTLGGKDEDYKKMESLPIFNKISLVQAILKEMLSIKERFEENKNKMLEKMRNMSANQNAVNNVDISSTMQINLELINKTGAIDITYYMEEQIK